MASARNLSRPGIFAKIAKVTRWVEQCACEWVIPGSSFRELSATDRLARIAANIENSGSIIDNRPKSRKGNYLPAINPSGEKEVMPRSEIWTRDRKFQCLMQARELSQKCLA